MERKPEKHGVEKEWQEIGRRKVKVSVRE